MSEGVRELDQEKLTPLLLLKYHDSIADAVADLGRPLPYVRASGTKWDDLRGISEVSLRTGGVSGKGRGGGGEIPVVRGESSDSKFEISDLRERRAGSAAADGYATLAKTKELKLL